MRELQSLTQLGTRTAAVQVRDRPLLRWPRLASSSSWPLGCHLSLWADTGVAWLRCVIGGLETATHCVLATASSEKGMR